MKKLLLILLCLPMIGFGQNCNLQDIFIFEFGQSRLESKLTALNKGFELNESYSNEGFSQSAWCNYYYLGGDSVLKTWDWYFIMPQLINLGCLPKSGLDLYYPGNTSLDLTFVDDKLYLQEITLRFKNFNEAMKIYNSFIEVFDKSHLFDSKISCKRILNSDGIGFTILPLDSEYSVNGTELGRVRQYRTSEDVEKLKGQAYYKIRGLDLQFDIEEDFNGKESVVIGIRYTNMYGTRLTSQGY